MTSLGGTLRRLRLESGIGLRDLARRLGVSSAYLSRVEHGIDATPTPERLQAIAEELGVPASMLLEVGNRVSPLVEQYLEEEPQAAAVFLTLARRGLDAQQLAEVLRFVDRRFGATSAEAPAERLASLLDPSRVVTGVRAADHLDAWEIGAARLATPEVSVGSLVTTVRRRAEQIDTSVGGGVGVIAVSAPRAVPAAALVVLDRPLRAASVGEPPLSVLVLILDSTAGRRSLLRIAHVARLASRGLVDAVVGLRDPDRLLHAIAQLELVG